MCATGTLDKATQGTKCRRMSFSGNAIHLICLCTSIACTVLLYRGYRRSGTPLLFWSALCFVFLSLNNLLLFANLAYLPELDLRVYRLASNLAAVTLLLYGFLWESE